MDKCMAICFLLYIAKKNSLNKGMAINIFLFKFKIHICFNLVYIEIREQMGIDTIEIYSLFDRWKG